MVLVPAATFLMGSPDTGRSGEVDEKPQRRVTLSRPFYMGETEVTQGQWKAVMGDSPWSNKEYSREGEDCAATYVSWEDAVEYCRRLGAREGREYRLPTEAEWVFACRGGTSSLYCFGDDASQLSRYGWFDEDVGARHLYTM